VAEQLNDRAVADELPLEGHYDQAITEFLCELDSEHLSDMGNSMALGRLQGLASQLNPELRAQLLNSTFRAVAPDEKMAEKVLSQFPGTMSWHSTLRNSQFPTDNNTANYLYPAGQVDAV
jgi:hypothetical protein